MVNEDRFEMKNRYYIFIALLALSLVSCQKEELYTGPCDVKVKAYVQDEVTISRAYTDMPSDYADFTAELFVAVADGSIAPISTTMTKQGEALTANLRLEQGDYYIYGYLPKTEGAALTFNATDNTASMTIPNIAGLSTTDALVIRKGDKLTILATDKSKNATLLMDHLMAKITPRFYIDSEYAQMRSIRIKKVEFSIDQAMTYTANVAFDNTQSTISWNTTWTPGATSNMEVVAYENAEPTETDTLKTADALACGACYVCPAQPIENLNMTVTYDVYDTKGQLVRPDAEATNKMQIKVSGNTLANLEAGKNYQLNIRIVPTYLYVLSDNDEPVLIIP